MATELMSCYLFDFIINQHLLNFFIIFDQQQLIFIILAWLNAILYNIELSLNNYFFCINYFACLIFIIACVILVYYVRFPVLQVFSPATEYRNPLSN